MLKNIRIELDPDSLSEERFFNPGGQDTQPKTTTSYIKVLLAYLMSRRSADDDPNKEQKNKILKDETPNDSDEDKIGNKIPPAHYPNENKELKD